MIIYPVADANSKPEYSPLRSICGHLTRGKAKSRRAYGLNIRGIGVDVLSIAKH